MVARGSASPPTAGELASYQEEKARSPLRPRQKDNGMLVAVTLAVIAALA